MSDAEYKKLEKKFTDLEEKVNAMGKVKPAKDKKPRKPSEYNKFMGKFMADDKKKNPDKDHAVRFKDAAKAWGEKK
jgi:hypothetical protein